MIMSGTKAARLLELRLIDIHGTRFYDVVYAHDDAPAERRAARVGVDDMYANPQVGHSIGVSYVMNIVTKIERR
jgi:hypothetical protein